LNPDRDRNEAAFAKPRPAKPWLDVFPFEGWGFRLFAHHFNDDAHSEFPELPSPTRVFDVHPEEVIMGKKLEDRLDPKAKGKKTASADFDRNRDGLYGGLPKARDKAAPGPASKHRPFASLTMTTKAGQKHRRIQK
jgi:hypothetical protein